MSFEEWGDCFIWTCDECGHIAAFKPNDFWACVDELKSRGWGFSREEGDWTHSCGRCRHKHRQTSILNQTIGRPREVKG
jgi:hypothetical protein